MQERIVQRFRNHLHGFSRMSYVHGNPFHELEKRGFAQTDIIDCSLGTNPYGCSPKVLASLQNHDWSDVHRYPDPEYRNFVEALLYFWKPLVSLQRDNILVGAGTSGLLEKILK